MAFYYKNVRIDDLTDDELRAAISKSCLNMNARSVKLYGESDNDLEYIELADIYHSLVAEQEYRNM